MAPDWQEISIASHYLTAVEVRKMLKEGEYFEALRGMEYLIESLTRADKRSLRFRMTKLMRFILRWKLAPEMRTSFLGAGIINFRLEIDEDREENPALTDQVIQEMWNHAFKLAVNEVRVDLDDWNVEPILLTWKEVFQDGYFL